MSDPKDNQRKDDAEFMAASMISMLDSAGADVPDAAMAAARAWARGYDYGINEQIVAVALRILTDDYQVH